MRSGMAFMKKLKEFTKILRFERLNRLNVFEVHGRKLCWVSLLLLIFLSLTSTHPLLSSPLSFAILSYSFLQVKCLNEAHFQNKEKNVNDVDCFLPLQRGCSAPREPPNQPRLQPPQGSGLQSGGWSLPAPVFLEHHLLHGQIRVRQSIWPRCLRSGSGTSLTAGSPRASLLISQLYSRICSAMLPLPGYVSGMVKISGV